MAAFIIAIRYTAPIEAVDALIKPHVTWLEAGREAGHFVGWGRRVPREGGVVLATAEDRATVEALAAADPFVAGGVAEAEVIEWAASWLADGLEPLRG